MEEKYCYTMDLYPQQYEDENRLYKFYETLGEEGRLTTTKCKDCGAILWPPRIICRECISDNLEWVYLPKAGKIVAFTVNVAGVAPQFKPPVIYAIIEFDNGVRMISALVDTNPEEVSIGVEVEPKVVEWPTDHLGRKRFGYFFRLKK